jgi:hypothetical protein
MHCVTLSVLSLSTDINHKSEEREEYKKDKEDKGTTLVTIWNALSPLLRKPFYPKYLNVTMYSGLEEVSGV